jgi:uncharacterized RDD family membrane protein YckC
VFGLRVVKIDGSRPGRGAIVIRNLLRIVELWMILLLLVVVISPLRQRVGDVAAGTVVVEKRQPDEGDAEE